MSREPATDSTTSRPKVLLVDDHSVVRLGIRQALSSHYQVWECERADQARKTADEFRPDLAVIDLSLPDEDGLALVSDLSRQFGGNLRIVAFSRHSDPGIIRLAFDKGASAYVTKQAKIDELMRAMCAVQAGERYLDGNAEKAVRLGQGPLPALTLDELTPREMELFRAMSEGLCANGLARRFGISTNTVGNHRRNIMRKLNLSSLAELMRLAAWLNRPAP